MSVIPENQGAVKLSEIYVDEALSKISTAVGEDALITLKQIYQLALDGNKDYHAFSDGRIQWTGDVINFQQDARNNSIYFRILKSDNQFRTIDLIMQGGATSGEQVFNDIPLANNELIYIEIHRSKLNGGAVILHNAVNGGSIYSGATVKKISLSASTGMPAISLGLDGDGDSLNIPIAFRHDWLRGATVNQDLMWACNGERWKSDLTLELGGSTAISQGGAILNFLEIAEKAWDAEIDATGWYRYNDSTTVPTDGDGGVVNAGVTFGIENTPSLVLSGLGSFNFEKTVTANIQGHGVSVDFKIYKGYRRKRLIARALFEFISGFSSDLIGFYVIADPMGTPKLLTPYQNILSGSKGEIIAPFDPLEDIELYRLCVHVRTTTIAPFKLLLDDVKINQTYFVQADAVASPQQAGFILPYGGNSDLDGWLLCDGRELPVASYSDLYASIGGSYGSRISGFFNLPDLRGQFVRGATPAINASFTSSNINLTTNAITLAGANINRTGLQVRFTTTGTLPAGLSINTDYWTILLSSGVFAIAVNLANALAGTAIDLTTYGSGTHTIKQSIDLDLRHAGAVGGAISGVGSSEDDSLQDHFHGIPIMSATGGGSGEAGGTGSVLFNNQTTGVNSARVSNETRVKNVACNYLIKLYNDKSNIIISNSRVSYGSNPNNASTPSDIVSFSSNLQGSLVPSVTAGTTGIRRIQFSREITISDRIILEIDCGTGGVIWVDAAQKFPLFHNAGEQFGISLNPVPGNPAQLDVYFGNGGADNDGHFWIDYPAWRWRVVLSSNPNAVETSSQEDIGVVKMYCGDLAPSGYLMCDGRQVSRLAFSKLFSVSGVKFGAGDGSTTFNLPDFRGVGPRGAVISSVGSTLGGSIIAVDVALDTVTVMNHNFNRSGFPVYLSGALPAGLSAGMYYVINVNTNTLAFAVSPTDAVNGIRVAITGATTGGSVSQFMDPDAANRLACEQGGMANGSVGSWQMDAFQSHRHNYIGKGGPNRSQGVVDEASNTTKETTAPIADGSNGAPRLSSETRNKNLNINFIVKY